MAEVSAGTNKRVTIIGAGFSGLASAYYLVRAGYKVDIIEKSDRVGGLIQTLETPRGLVETAANGFLNSKRVEDLFTDVGVPLIGTLPDARRRFIWRAGRMKRWPLSVAASLNVAWFLLRYVLAKSSVRPLDGSGGNAPESVDAWGARVMGREATAYLLNTALQGIYAGDPSRMSAALIFRRLFQPAGKVGRPKIRGSVSAENGMGQLIAGLQSYLVKRGVTIEMSSEETSPSTDHPRIIATDPKSAADLLSRFSEARGTSDLRVALLRQIEMNPVTTTTAFFPSSKIDGFGVLYPSVENRFALGTLRNDRIFENRGTNSETWIVGRPKFSENKTQTMSAIQKERSELFGLNDLPVQSTTTVWPRGIPHYTIELARMIDELEKSHDNLFLIGNYLGDLGLAKILERASRWPDRLAKEGRWT